MWPFAKPNPPLPQTLCLTAPVDLAALAKGETDQQPKFRIVANTGVPMRLENYADPVVIDLKGAKFEKDVTPIIFNHDTTLRIGHTTSQDVRATGKPLGIFVEGVVSSGMGIAAGFIEDSKRGFPFQASVGASVENAHHVPAGSEVTVNGQTFQGPLIVASKTRIKEISVTVLGADPNSLSIAASFNNQLPPKRNDMEPNSIQAAVIAERERIQTINAMLQPPHGGWDMVENEVEKLRASAIAGSIPLSNLPSQLQRINELQAFYKDLNKGQSSATPYHFKIHGTTAGVHDSKTIAAALLVRLGRESLAEKTYGEHVLQASRPLQSSSLVDLCKSVLTAEGRQIPRDRNELIRAGFGFSTNTLTDAISDAVHTILRDQYAELNQTWRSFCSIKNVGDFRDHTSLQPQAGGQLDELGEQGQIHHSTLDQQTFTFRIDTYAKQLRFGRQQLYNDAIGAIDEVPTMFARMALRKIADLAYETLLGAGSHFHADNNNLLTGAGSALSVTALSNAIIAMRTQRDDEGNDLDITPRVLLVPPELEQVAKGVLESDFLERSGADSLPTGNPLKRMVRLEVEQRLSNTTKFGNATLTNWFLFAGPIDEPMIVAFLDSQSPRIEFFGLEADPNHLGVSWRIYHDFGAAMGDKKAAVRSDGA